MKFRMKTGSIDDFRRDITNGYVIQHHYRDNKHSVENFIDTQYIIIDVDDSKIPMAEFIINMWVKPTLGVVTYSNDDSKRKYRFHLIFIFDEPFGIDDYKHIYDEIARVTNLTDTKDHCGRSTGQIMNGTYGTDKQYYVSYAIYKTEHFINDSTPYLQQLMSLTESQDVMPLFATIDDLLSYYDYSEEHFGYPRYYKRKNQGAPEDSKYPPKNSPEWAEMIARRNAKIQEAAYYRRSKFARSLYVQTIKNPEVRLHLESLEKDPNYNIAKYDDRFTEEQITNYLEQLQWLTRERILDLQDEINAVGYVGYLNNHKKDFNLIRETPTRYRVEYGFGITAPNHRKLFIRYKHNSETNEMDVNRFKDGEHRRIGLYTDVLYMVDIDRYASFEELVFNLIHRVTFYYDNSDHVLNTNCLIRKVLDALICIQEGKSRLKDQRLGGRLKASKIFALEHRVSCSTIIRVAFGILHFERIDTWYDPTLTPAENIKKQQEKNAVDIPSLKTMVRYAKSRGYKTTDHHKVINTIVEWYDVHKSVKENLAYAKQHNIHVSINTLYNFCKLYCVSTKGQSQLPEKIKEYFKSKFHALKKDEQSTSCNDFLDLKLPVGKWKLFTGKNPYLNNPLHPEWAARADWSDDQWQKHLNMAA